LRQKSQGKRQQQNLNIVIITIENIFLNSFLQELKQYITKATTALLNPAIVPTSMLSIETGVNRTIENMF
jgi:hypothetical protein